MIDVKPLIEQANEMAPLPPSAVRLAELASRPECHLDEVAELIAFDQALTGKLLRAANSAASASAVPIGTVSEALMRMGTAHVLTLAVASGARPLLQRPLPAYGLAEGTLWRHSVAAAVAAETAPNFCQIEVPFEAFTAALLHDVGKLVMARFLDPETLALIRTAQEVEYLSMTDAESLLLGVNHAELGGLVAQHWQLPPRLVQGILYHHDPEHGLDVICDLTCVADQIARRIEAGLDGREFEPAIPPEVAERLGLTPAILDEFCPIASARYAQVSGRYNAL